MVFTLMKFHYAAAQNI